MICKIVARVRAPLGACWNKRESWLGEGIVKGKTMRISTIAAAVLAASIGFIFLFARKTPAQGTELFVVVSDGMKPSMEELAPQIERSIGRRLKTQFSSSKAQEEKILSGEPFDAAI